ncbi:hypothetical protein KUCAC02_028595, partial [Chaenocephalus aceratus]
CGSSIFPPHAHPHPLHNAVRRLHSRHVPTKGYMAHFLISCIVGYLGSQACLLESYLIKMKERKNVTQRVGGKERGEKKPSAPARAVHLSARLGYCVSCCGVEGGAWMFDRAVMRKIREGISVISSRRVMVRARFKAGAKN